MSEAYTGRMSDKALTLDCGFFDRIPKYTSILADKGFNLLEDCAARSLYFIVPLGRRGSSQMSSTEVRKKSNIAKVRILVKQVVGRLKTVRILNNELPITLLSHLNDITFVCSALCNMMDPIFKD